MFNRLKSRIRNIFKTKLLVQQQSSIASLKLLPNVFIHPLSNISVDANFTIENVAKFYIGNNTSCRKFCSFLVYSNASLILHNGVSFNNFCSINCLGHIEIGEHTLIGESVKIYDHNHKYSYQEGRLIVEKAKFSIGKVVIGANCWIGSNVTILNNVIIGENSIIGANCLIHKSVPANSIVKHMEELIITQQ